MSRVSGLLKYFWKAADCIVVYTGRIHTDFNLIKGSQNTNPTFSKHPASLERTEKFSGNSIVALYIINLSELWSVSYIINKEYDPDTELKIDKDITYFKSKRHA